MKSFVSMEMIWMRKLGALAIALLLFLIPVAAHADVVQPGDYIKFTDRPGSPGGEFKVTVYDTPGGPCNRLIHHVLRADD